MNKDFERLMEPEAWAGDARSDAARLAIRQVTDTVHLCCLWWREQQERDVGLARPTAADLLKMTEMMLTQGNENLRRAIGN